MKLTAKQFAIRPNFRNHKVLTREVVINLVAAAVGPGHKVDLKNYDKLILIEIYKVRASQVPCTAIYVPSG
jgi:tRNA acetyltransferase TAN1